MVTPNGFLVVAGVAGQVLSYKCLLEEEGLVFSLHDDFDLYQNPHGDSIDQQEEHLQHT